MVDRRIFLVFLVAVLFVAVLHAERARNDNLQEDEIDFENDNRDSAADDFIETMKRFLLGKKTTTTTTTPSSGAISALFTTTRASRFTPSTTKSSGGMFGGRTSSTSRYGGYSTTTSRFGRTRATSSPTKDGCGLISPCKNGGTCKTLSSGNYYCFCSQDYYGKNCDNKFISTGSANNDRGRKDHCASSPCRNSGECVGLRTTYYCRCKTPYYGINCDKRFSKREEIDSSERELNSYERDLQEDTEDLRRVLTQEDMK